VSDVEGKRQVRTVQPLDNTPYRTSAPPPDEPIRTQSVRLSKLEIAASGIFWFTVISAVVSGATLVATAIDSKSAKSYECAKSAANACRQRGGVWISSEGACVAPMPVTPGSGP
jgi:hypothetical protein